MRASSLRARLIWLILAALALVLVPLGIYSFQRTVKEVDELSDGRLAQSARTLQVLIEHAGLPAIRGSQGQSSIVVPITGHAAQGILVHGHTYESEVGFQVVDSDGKVLLTTASLGDLPPPRPTDAGFRDTRQGDYRWRIFTLPPDAEGVVIRSGERYDSRHDIMQALWIEHSLPLLLGMPILGLLVGWAVTRGLRPLQELAQRLSTRRVGSREPLEIRRAPAELAPVISALNEQFARLENTLERERRFSADVAHELRTPLASTIINLENIQAHQEPSETEAALDGARRSVAALARRVEQLLALARLESSSQAGERRPMDLVAVAGSVIEELAPLIVDSKVELTVDLPRHPLPMTGYEAAMAALLRNLLENALRHVPDGGSVQLSMAASDGVAEIDVIDNGEGIPPERREAVFARFHREAGSRGDGYGLGLSIVQRAAQLHDADIALLDSPMGHGLRVRVRVPMIVRSPPAL
ncbi:MULTISPECIES: ATP-binding protein [Dyella]|uniref:histidine kinase n=2 Tax=Dyella TaxID=231454 RepID=A0A4V2NMB3_9GAMM|nr:MULTISPECIES: ATP-binding protein [Dyella]TBR39741.1 two-component sensor histidine kinase [Dyella terrae]TCI12677.1 two-component sensor histidine kinase [Dyella soli]